MTKGAIQAANKAKKEQITHVMKSNRNRLQKEEEMEKQTKINAGRRVVKQQLHGCRFGVSHKHYAQLGNPWQWYQKNANKRRTRQSQPQEKEKKTFNSFFTTVSAARRIVQEWQYVKHQQKSRRRQRNKKSLMKKLRQSWMCCKMQ